MATTPRSPLAVRGAGRPTPLTGLRPPASSDRGVSASLATGKERRRPVKTLSRASTKRNAVCSHDATVHIYVYIYIYIINYDVGLF